MNYVEPYLAYTGGYSVYEADDGQEFTLDEDEYDFPLVRAYLNHGTAEFGFGVSRAPCLSFLFLC